MPGLRRLRQVDVPRREGLGGRGDGQDLTAGSMIQPLPPHAPLASTRLDDRLNAPERTAATTPAASHAPSSPCRRARREQELDAERGVGRIRLQRPQLGADVEAERHRPGVNRRETPDRRDGTTSPPNSPAPRAGSTCCAAAARRPRRTRGIPGSRGARPRARAACRPRTRRAARGGGGAAGAQGLDGIPAGDVERARTPRPAPPSRTPGAARAATHARRCARTRPPTRRRGRRVSCGSSQTVTRMRRVPVATRCAREPRGSRYSRCPGTTSKASYHGVEVAHGVHPVRLRRMVGGELRAQRRSRSSSRRRPARTR